jgi:hypothetical protein
MKGGGGEGDIEADVGGLRGGFYDDGCSWEYRQCSARVPSLGFLPSSKPLLL